MTPHLASWTRSGLLLIATLTLLTLLPTPLLASTMGFARQFDLPPSAGPSLHWISLPWSYQPQDVGTPGVLDAEDLCRDLGGEETVAAVLRWDEPTSTVQEHTCGTENPFALDRGEGYGVRNVPGRTIRGAVVGAHDDAFAYSIPATAGSQLSWLSVPYHLRIPENHGDLGIDAEDLCRQIGLTEVLAVVRWNAAVGAYEAYGCGSELAMPFEIVRGLAYGVINRGQQTLDWQPIHY